MEKIEIKVKIYKIPFLQLLYYKILFWLTFFIMK